MIKYKDYGDFILTENDVDDFNKIKYCRHCKARVDELFPDTCPQCQQPFESTADYFFRKVAYAVIILFGIYLWQKVMIGL